MTYEDAQMSFEEHMEAGPHQAPSFRQIYAQDEIEVREEWNNYIDMLARDGDITRDEAEDWDNPY